MLNLIISKGWSSRIYQVQITARFQFFLHLKKDKVLGKNTVTFWRYSYGQFVCFHDV